ncbi:hypothetical protein L9F63_022371, partial [Diploptera punctata]
NLEKIIGEAVWSDDAKKWRLPELIIIRTKLPPAEIPVMSHSLIIFNTFSTVNQLRHLKRLSCMRPSAPKHSYYVSRYRTVVCDELIPKLEDSQSEFISPSNTTRISPLVPRKGSSPPSDRRISSPDTDDENKAIFKKLQRSEQEDIAGNYFKPKRAAELLNRAKEDASRAFKYTNRNKGANNTNGINNILNMSLSQNGFHSSLNALNLNSSIAASNGNNFLNSSWSSSVNGNGVAPTNGNGWVVKEHHTQNAYKGFINKKRGL